MHEVHLLADINYTDRQKTGFRYDLHSPATLEPTGYMGTWYVRSISKNRRTTNYNSSGNLCPMDRKRCVREEEAEEKP